MCFHRKGIPTSKTAPERKTKTSDIKDISRVAMEHPELDETARVAADQPCVNIKLRAILIC